MFSYSVATAFKFYMEYEPTKKTFADTIYTAKLSQVLNDVFDVLNGRHMKTSINRTNWPKNRDVTFKYISIWRFLNF